MDDGIFAVRARRCRRCGRLLTSAEAVGRGYGRQCAAKARMEERAKQPIPGQMTIEDWFKDNDKEE